MGLAEHNGPLGRACGRRGDICCHLELRHVTGLAQQAASAARDSGAILTRFGDAAASPSRLCRYVVVSSYLYLRDNAGIAHPENLLLVFGVSLVSDFFMLSTLVFGGVYYCRQQRAFRRADRRNEVPAQFSNTTTRKYGKRGGRVPREYNARNAL